MAILTVNDIINIHNIHKDIMVVNNKRPNNILFIGSCRVTPLLNYFIHDPYFGSNYNYLCILVYNENMIELSKTCVNNERFKHLLKNSTILVSEYLKSYNYFNSSPDSDLNLFKMETKFDHAIFIPNFCDPLIYTKDILTRGNNEIKETYSRYINGDVSFDIFSAALNDFHHKEIERYCAVIRKSIIPELEQFIKETVYKHRIAHTLNHPSNIVFLEIYRLILQKLFSRTVPSSVIQINKKHEFLDSSGYHTRLTYYDKLCLHIEYPEEIYTKKISDIYISSTEIFFKV
jgi:hypothetical protein